MTERVATGIEGLDQLINGGFIKNRAFFVQGSPGTGKSTLAFQFLVNGAKDFDEPGLLVSMESTRSDIIEDMKAFEWNAEELISEEKLNIVGPPGGIEAPKTITSDEMINFIFDHVNKIDAKRLVIDSINSMEISIGHMDRRELLRFITLIRDLECTTILVSEKTEDMKHREYMYLSHGVIELYYFRRGANRLRGIEVIKMRGSDHSNLIHSLNILSGVGIEVLPHELDLSS